MDASVIQFSFPWPQLQLRTFSIFLQLLIPAERLTEQILRAQAARVSAIKWRIGTLEVQLLSLTVFKKT